LLLGYQVHAQTTTSVQEVYKIFQAKCISCHDNASPEANLDLEGTGVTELSRAINVAQKLTNINPTNAYAVTKGYKRVYPGRPDRSFLFRKINNGLDTYLPALHTNEGQDMPAYGGPGPLTDVEKEIIRQWIIYGAKNTGVQFDKSLLESYYTVGGEQAFPDGPPPAPAAGEGFQIKMGPFFLPPDGEVEYYQKYELALPADVEVNQLDLKMSGYSHHFIVYNFTGSGANSIPAGLRLAANHNQINLVAAVQEALDLKLPPTTAFKWDNNLVLDLNSHYINYSLSMPYKCEAYLNVYTQPLGTADQEMFATLLVNDNIPIANNGNTIAHTASEYQFGADSLYIWGLMGHTHKYGTGYKVWKRLSNGQKGDLLYDGSCPMGTPGCPSPYFDYQHIPLRYYLPFLPIKWSNGLIHEATYVNDGPSAVNFGPTSDDEMMVLITFYTENPLTTDTDTPTDPTFATQARVVPNPASGQCTVIVPGIGDITQFRLFDLLGRQVISKNNLPKGGFELSLQGLPKGLYHFDADGQTGRIIVE
jgi:hypothetical protein